MGMMSELLSNIDPNTMVLGLVFIILYVLINFSLSKIFKKERASSAIISLCISLLAVYGLNRTDLNFSNIFFNLGFSENTLYLIVPWIILGLAILASFVKDKTTGKRSFRLYRLLIALGAMIFIIGLTPIYQKAIFIAAGLILILLGFFLWLRKKIHLKKNINPVDGTNILIEEAKNFKKWALRQRNPKFYGGWTYFVSYLHHKRGYPRGAKAICNQLGISQRDFDNIFNKYGLV
jgi:hypothetical protein